MGLFDSASRLWKGFIGAVQKPAGVPDRPQTPAAPAPSTSPPVILPARRITAQGGASTQIPGGEVFSDQDPYLSGGNPLIPKDGDALPRRFQYTSGVNIQITPRGTETISFSMLRMLGESTMVRIIIEHLKNILKSHEWAITADDERENGQYADAISTISNFLEYPDGEHAWDEWVGLVCEESLVIDALTLYKRKTYGGQLAALEIIDGSTIKMLIDTRGFIPNPPTPAYQQFLYGVPKTWYTKDEMIYAPRNRRANKFYGFSEVEQLIVKINETVRREFYNLAQYTDGNTPAGIATLPKEWNIETIKKFDLYFNELLSGNAQRRSKLFFGPEGMQIHKFHDNETFGLFSKYDEWLARVACFTFGVSPMPFITLTNRAAAQEMGDVEAEGGVATLKMFIERLINRIIKDDFQQPHVKFDWITDRSRLQEKRVKRNVQYTQSAIFTPNEVRADEGKPPIDGIGDQLYFNGVPLGQVATGAGSASSAGSEGEGESPARPELEDGSRPVVASAHVQAIRKCMTEELGKWERFALKRFDEGKPWEATQFEAEYLTNDECLQVIKGVQKSRTKDQLKHLFDTRRAGIRAIRIEPHNASDAARYSGDMKGVLREILSAKADELANGKAATVTAQPSTKVEIQNTFDEAKMVAVIKSTLEESHRSWKETEEGRAAMEKESVKAIVEGQAKALEGSVEKMVGAMLEAAKASKQEPAIINLPEMKPTVINKVEAVASPAAVNVSPAPVTVQQAPVAKAERPKRSYRVLRDHEGNMVGLEEK